MKKLLKTIQFLTLVTFILAGMLSCTNLLGKKSANESETAKKNAAYITLSVAGLGRNVNPVINADALTNLVLKGTKTGGTELTLGHWNAVNELQTAKCAVSTGEWSFTLTAKAGGVNGTTLSKTITEEIELGDNALSFELSISDDGAGDENSVGSFNITLNYDGADNKNNVSYALATLEDMDDTVVSGFNPPIRLTPSSNAVVFATQNISVGTYRAKVMFFAESNEDGVDDFEIAPYSELVQISSGLTSSATRQITSFDNLYTINYHLNDGALAAGVTLQETFTRKSTITLPDENSITRANYVFGGWYTDQNCTAGNEISTITNITTNLDVYAKWHHTVRFVTDHGTAPDDLIFEEEETLTLTDTNLLVLPVEGYYFCGWYSNSSYENGTRVRAGQNVTTNLTLYAKWVARNGPNDGFVFVEGGTVVGSNDYNQNRDHGNTYIGAFPFGRTVTLSSFYISDHEVTQGEYDAVMGTNPSNFNSDPESEEVQENRPVENVSWYDAIYFCNKYSESVRLTPCYKVDGNTDVTNWNYTPHNGGSISGTITCDMTADGYRLPTEAEWEYAARGGQKTYGTAAFANYYAGAATTDYMEWNDSNLERVGWYSNISSNKTHEVKKKIPNALNLCDMSGNVMEWCWDWYNDSVGTGSVTDPCGASSGSDRLIRGGSWRGISFSCSVPYRSNNDPSSREDYIGFRLVRSAESDIHNVNYVTAHGNAPAATKVRTVITSETLPTLTKDGWIFCGWYTDSSYNSDKKASVGQRVTTDLTLYAKWFTDDFVFVQGGTVVGRNDYNQNLTGAFPAGRTVTLSSFYISDHELTQREYVAVMGTNPSYFTSDPASGEVQENKPVENVSWYDAIYFCNKYSESVGLTPCYKVDGNTSVTSWDYKPHYGSIHGEITCDMTANGYRLPTEAEWEYAARGGQETYGTPDFTNYFAGAATTSYTSSINRSLDPVAWYSGDSNRITHEVKKKAPNALNLYDMSGNVGEWCWDWYSDSVGTGSVIDPCGASLGSYHLIRGGSWSRVAYYCSVSCRDPYEYFRDREVGFRLVRSAR